MGLKSKIRRENESDRSKIRKKIEIKKIAKIKHLFMRLLIWNTKTIFWARKMNLTMKIFS
jgi:hypothetical protein